MHLGIEEKIMVGTPDTIVDSTALGGERSVIFEDDGTTGYFYAVRPGAELEILDALHVYDVVNVTDRHIPVTAMRCMIFSVRRAFAAMLSQPLATGKP
jgi:hypothetical protein